MLNKPNKILALLLVTFLVAGAIENFSLSDNRTLYELAVAHAFIVAILLFAWCKSHIQFNEINAPSSSALLVGLMAPIGVPLYFFRGFGFKDGSIKTVKAIVFLLVSMALYEVGAYISGQLGS